MPVLYLTITLVNMQGYTALQSQKAVSAHLQVSRYRLLALHGSISREECASYTPPPHPPCTDFIFSTELCRGYGHPTCFKMIHINYITHGDIVVDVHL